MSLISRLLTQLGAHGPVLLMVSIAAGVALEPFGAPARDVVPFAAFLLTLGSFLSAALAVQEKRDPISRIVATLMWVALAIPALAAIVIARVDISPELEFGVLVAALAPPVGSAAALAALLNLKPRLALIGSIGLTLAAPFTMPLLASALGSIVLVDIAGLLWRLGLIVIGAAAVALLALCFPRPARVILPSPQAAAGIAVIGLVLVGLATGHAVRALWVEDAARLAALLGVASLANVTACALTAVVFASWGWRTALTVGLLAGNRNVTLAWAALGPSLPPVAQNFVVASVVPVLMLPLAVKTAIWLLAQCNRPKGHDGAQQTPAASS